jgi:hypothetical protein
MGAYTKHVTDYNNSLTMEQKGTDREGLVWLAWHANDPQEWPYAITLCSAGVSIVQCKFSDTISLDLENSDSTVDRHLHARDYAKEDKVVYL